MLHKLLRAATVALLASAAPLPAQAPPAPPTVTDADPALWVVKDEDTTIYLFGTIHILKPGLSWFDEAVRTAFDKSGELVIETDVADPAAAQALFLKLAISPTGPTLTEKLPADKREAYARALAAYGLPATAFDRTDAWFAATNLSMLPILKLGYDPSQGAEKVLIAAAAKEGKKVGQLETLEEQVSILDNLPEKAQIAFLTETIEELPRAGEMLEEMVREWAEGDPAALAETMNEGLDASPELAKALLFDRNARWADWIDRRLDQPGVVFLAVGAGHLAGDRSVQAELAQRGFAVRRIEY